MKVRIEYKSGKVEIATIELNKITEALVSLVKEKRVVSFQII